MRSRRFVLSCVVVLLLGGVSYVAAQGPFSAQILAALRAYGFASPGVLTTSSLTTTSLTAGTLTITPPATGTFGFWSRSAGAVIAPATASDTLTGTAGLLSVKSGNTPQEVRVAGGSGGSTYVFVKHDGTSGFFASALGNGYYGTYGGSPMILMTGGVNRWIVAAGGSLIANADATYSIGSAGANRPLDLFLSNSLTVGTTPSASGAVRLPKGASINWYGSAASDEHGTLGGSVDLVNNTPTSVFEVAVPDGAMVGGSISYCIEVSNNAPNYQSHCGVATYSAVNKAASYTTDIREAATLESASLSTGTLTDAWTIVTGTNKITITLNANSNLAATITKERIYYTVSNNSPRVVTPL
jgi:hypothetical protein